MKKKQNMNLKRPKGMCKSFWATMVPIFKKVQAGKGKNNEQLEPNEQASEPSKEQHGS